MATLTSAEAAQRLIDALDKITADQSWADYLRFLNSMHNYSPFNRMLIFVQCPHATHIKPFGNKAGTTGWKAVNRHVKRGEKAIHILAPMIRQDKDEDGKVIREHLYGFRAVPVFDVSQTDGDPLPENPVPPVTLLTGEHDGLDALTRHAVDDLGYTVRRGECGGANGYTDPRAKLIKVRDDVDDAQAVKTMAHELAHAHLHADMCEYIACRGTAEVEAESVAFLVADRLGLDTSGYTFGYVTGWALEVKGGEKPSAVIKASLARIVDTADTIIAAITAPAEQVAA